VTFSEDGKWLELTQDYFKWHAYLLAVSTLQVLLPVLVKCIQLPITMQLLQLTCRPQLHDSAPSDTRFPICVKYLTIKKVKSTYVIRGAENAVPLQAQSLYCLNRLEFTQRCSSWGTSEISLRMFSFNSFGVGVIL
jgi:hypothetical protein